MREIGLDVLDGWRFIKRIYRKVRKQKNFLTVSFEGKTYLVVANGVKYSIDRQTPLV